MSDRIILHCDCNSFFASVETALHPEFKKRPMAVCGNPEARHGIVLAKNELAKKHGIKTAETIFSAKKKCPDLLITEPHYSEYFRFSKLVNEIYHRYTDKIEPFGIDESWLDVSASQKIFGGGEKIAEKIRNDVKSELGITVSIGVSFNKVFAKLGSDYKKPDAVTVISKQNFKDIVHPLPVTDLLFIGKKTENILLTMGIRTIGDLANTDSAILQMRLGKSGEILHKYACGEDDSPVSAEREEAKSIGNGFTFKHDLVGFDECCAGIDFLVEEIASRLRQNKMKCLTVQLTIKDPYLRSIQRQAPTPTPTNDSRIIANAVYEILKSEWSDTKPIRMLTVTATNLIDEDSYSEQIDIFSICNKSENKEFNSIKRNKAIDKIRQKYGLDSIVNASVIRTDIGIYNRNTQKGKKEQ